MHDVAVSLGDDWVALARRLGLSDATLERIVRRIPDDPVAQGERAIAIWARSRPLESTGARGVCIVFAAAGWPPVADPVFDPSEITAVVFMDYTVRVGAQGTSWLWRCTRSIAPTSSRCARATCRPSPMRVSGRWPTRRSTWCPSSCSKRAARRVSHILRRPSITLCLLLSGSTSCMLMCVLVEQQARASSCSRTTRPAAAATATGRARRWTRAAWRRSS